MSLLQHVVDSYELNGEPFSDQSGSHIGYATVRHTDEPAFGMATIVSDMTIRYPANIHLTQGQIIKILEEFWVVSEQPRKIGSGLRYEVPLHREND